jgi:EF hand
VGVRAKPRRWCLWNGLDAGEVDGRAVADLVPMPAFFLQIHLLRPACVYWGISALALGAMLATDGSPAIARRSTGAIFTSVDADKDGTVNEVEARQAASALFDRLDTDKDGTLDENELRGHLTGRELQASDPDHDATLTNTWQVEQRFKAADANHDEKLKIDEFTSAPGAALVKLITYQVEGLHRSSR